VILGLLGLGAETGYEIKRIADISTRFFWGASYGQIYPELRRLERDGLVEASEAPRGGRARRPYRLTAQGRAALEDWLRRDDEPLFDIRDEGLLKVFFADLLEPGERLQLVARMRRDHELRLRHFRAIEEDVGSRPPDSTLLALRYGIAYLEWNVRWWRSLERELNREDRSGSSRQAGSSRAGSR
jgi:PadR family transcriptional regulator, regulatory protein AphA